MLRLQNEATPAIQPQLKKVIPGILNVRAGRSVQFKIVRKLNRGMQVQVFHTENDWSKISVNAEEWVSSKFLETP
jgi:uncharacterized protein YgiM (DUF1202 family)